MKVSAAFLMRSAGETGFQPAILEKVIRLGALANEITRHPLLGNALLLKGGTALSEEEAAFPRSAQRGEFRPALLGQTATVVVELANHPAIKWKLGHIRKRLRQ